MGWQLVNVRALQAMVHLMLLSQPEILERIKLYDDLKEAMKRYSALDAALPQEPPEGFDVTWAANNVLAEAAVKGVCIGAWKSLRAAALIAARKDLDEAENRVRAFESGEAV